MEIGEKIKQLRTEKKLSQKELALRIGVTQTNIAYFETRGNAITLENIFKIATALEVSIKSLLFDGIDYTSVPNNEDLLIAKDKEIEDLRKEVTILELTIKRLEENLEVTEKNINLYEDTIAIHKKLLAQSEEINSFLKDALDRFREQKQNKTY